MRIIANTHKTGARLTEERTSDTFEIRLYAKSSVIGDLTVIDTIPMFTARNDPYYALCRTLEEFSTTVANLTKEGENCGEIRIEKATVCTIRSDSSKRRLCYYSEEEPDEVFYNMLLIAMRKAYGD